MKVSCADQIYGASGRECLRQDLEDAPALTPLALRRRPAQGAGVMGVGHDVAIENVGQERPDGR